VSGLLDEWLRREVYPRRMAPQLLTEVVGANRIDVGPNPGRLAKERRMTVKTEAAKRLTGGPA